MNKRFFSIKRMCFIAIFSALSVLFYTIIPKIKLPIFPEFLEINFSMIPIMIASLMLGPIDAFICTIIRFLVKIPMTHTACVGEAADLLIGSVVAIASGLIYNHSKLKRKELIFFIAAFTLWILMSVITNMFINIPFYRSAIPGGIDAIIGACNQAFSLISGNNIITITENNFMFYYIFLAVIPFNIILALIVLIITLLIHKRLKILYTNISLK